MSSKDSKDSKDAPKSQSPQAQQPVANAPAVGGGGAPNAPPGPGGGGAVASQGQGTPQKAKPTGNAVTPNSGKRKKEVPAELVALESAGSLICLAAQLASAARLTTAPLTL